MQEHTYPSVYPPDAHWSLAEAWGILDQVTPGVLPEDVRAFLAGLISGTLMRVKAELQQEKRDHA